MPAGSRQRALQEWLDALRPLGTDGHKLKHYYTDESVGIATGFLIAAVHAAGLVSLTHTPSPMGFLTAILGRPKDIERPFLLLVVGYPAADAKVPDIARRPLDEIATFLPPWLRVTADGLSTATATAKPP